MPALRVYLLLGLLLHKAVWEALKRSRGRPKVDNPATGSVSPMIVKVVKVAILACVIAQTLLPDVLPIADDPLSLRLAGVAVYTAGLVAAVLSRFHLGANWSDIEAMQVKRNQAVVSNGLYRYIRHPIYVGDLALLLGLELALNSWLFLAVVVLAPVVLYRAMQEEGTLQRELPGYQAYCEQTKRFIPFII